MKLSRILLGLALGSFGCSVDLGRDEAFLSILLEGTPEGTSEVLLSIRYDDEELAYQERLALTTDGTLERVPTLSLRSGFIEFELDLVDDGGALLGMTTRRELVLRSGHTTRARIGYEAQVVRDPVSGETTEIPRSEVEVEEVMVASVELPPPGEEGQPLEARVDLGTLLPELLTRLERDLSGIPTRLLLRGLTVRVSSSEESLDLDDVWSGPAAVRLQGPISGDIATLTPVEVETITRMLTPPVDVTAWVSQSNGAFLVLAGPEGREQPEEGEPPSSDSLELRLDLWGAR